MRPFDSIITQGMENEMRAISKLCNPGANSNIVSVLKWGRLRASPYFFFDMELCDFNLETYISRLWVLALTQMVPHFACL